MSLWRSLNDHVHEAVGKPVIQLSSVLELRPVRFLVLVLTVGGVLASSSAGAQLADPIAQPPDGSRMRAGRVLKELQQRGCDEVLSSEVGQTCVDDALAAVYPLGFSIQTSSTSPPPIP